MEISARIVSLNNPKFHTEIEKLEIPFEYTENSLFKTVIVEIIETNPQYEKIMKLALKHDVSVTYEKHFSTQELQESQWLAIFSTGHFGYPQPEGTFLEKTFNLSCYCLKCGIGKIQNNPFRFKSNPKQKHSSFFQLNWIFDEYFVRPNVYEICKQEHISGIHFVHPVLDKDSTVINEIFQMVIDSTLGEGLNTKSLSPVTCKYRNEEFNPNYQKLKPEDKNNSFCGRIKYHHPKKEMYEFSPSAFAQAADVNKTYEYFGSGASAEKMIIVSKKFYSLAVQHKWRGLIFEPIRLTNGST